MYHSERQLAVKIVAEACGLGQAVQETVVRSGGALTKGDRSPVTMADLAIQAVVSHRLAEAYADDPLLGEEDSGALSTSPEMAEAVLKLVRTNLPDIDHDGIVAALDRGDHDGHSDRYWVLDPVDGTKGFLRGDHYAVALALVAGGEVVVGVLGCPNLEIEVDGARHRGALFAAVRGAGTSMMSPELKHSREVLVDCIDDPSQAIMCESVESAHAAHSVHADIAALLGMSTEPYRIDSQCKYGVLARGDASIYLRLPSKKGYREKVWDHAAGALVIEEAGGRVSDLDGRPLDFSAGRYLPQQRGIIATNGHIHEQVLAAARSALQDAE